jgi:predicted O-linked N-acetylglucosamine transferase (SPINDLY family)
MDTGTAASLSLEAALEKGVAHHRAGELGAAESLYRHVLSRAPNHAHARYLLGLLAEQVGRFDDARQLMESAVALKGDHCDALNALGRMLLAQSRVGEAIGYFERAVACRGDWSQTHYNLGTARLMSGDTDGAVAALRRAVELEPTFAPALENLAGALVATNQAEEAERVLDRALEIAPHAVTWNNLGHIRKSQGRLAEAIEAFRRAVEMEPGNPAMGDNLLLAMNYHEGLSAQAIFEAHLRWAGRHAEPLYANIAPHVNDRSPERRLRVGYVSPDFKMHPVGLFIEPVIEGHRAEHVEVFCYSDVASPDAVTQRLRDVTSGGWRDLKGASDEAVGRMIRADAIDILVDLAGHTARNRMLTFARKPAPVQVSWMGYVTTTGLATMDYGLSDQYLDPPGKHEPFRTETLVRLPRSYVCYKPLLDCPPVSELPAERNGFVTFACMNSFAKVTPQALSAWARVLDRVPGSRLVLHSDRSSHLDSVKRRLAELELDVARVEFVGKRPLAEYFAAHNDFDIALDPFPHNGGTTTCDALHMGVPVVTLVGEHAVNRAGLSLLATVGLNELAAESIDQYVELAALLALDLPRLAELRRTLRPRMQASPLMDATAFVRDLEDAYRWMWRRWCNAAV